MTGLNSPRDQGPLGTRIEEAWLSPRAVDHLHRAGIKTLEELTLLREWELFRAGLWLGDVRKIVAALSRRGLSLREPSLGGPVRRHETVPERASGGQPWEDLASERRRQRDAAIIAARARGDTLQEAGAPFGLSRERVRQILARAGADDTASSRRARARRKAQAAEESREEVLSRWREGAGLPALSEGLGFRQAALRELIKRHATSADYAARRLALARTPRRTPPRYSDEQLIQAVKQAVQAAGGVPTGGKYVQIAQAQGLPSLATVSNRFGGWNNAVSAAGYPPRPGNQRPYRRGWTEEKCLEALRELVGQLGRLPSREDYRALARSRPGLPSPSTLRTRVGTWTTIAGLVEPGEGPASPPPPDATPLAAPDEDRKVNRRSAHLGVVGATAPRETHPSSEPRYDRAKLGPTVEALWRKGMRYREVAEHLDMAQETVRELVCERVPRVERVELIAEKLRCRYVSDDLILEAIQDATQILGHPPAKPAYERLVAEGLVEGPHAGVISRRLGWSKALTLAGDAPPARRPHGAPDPKDFDLQPELAEASLGKG